MMLPLAIHHRLDVLAEAAQAAQATRSEIIGMLIATAELDSEVLERSIMTYRKITVGDVVQDQLVADAEPGENVIHFERRGPGRPSRREAHQADART